MTDEEYEAERARIRAIYDRWEPVLGLDAWLITLDYHTGPYVCADGTPSGNAYATAAPHWDYQSASLSFNLQKTRTEDDDDLEDIVVHECVHVLLHELRGTAAMDDHQEHEEHAATMITRALIRAAGQVPGGVPPEG